MEVEGDERPMSPHSDVGSVVSAGTAGSAIDSVLSGVDLDGATKRGEQSLVLWTPMLYCLAFECTPVREVFSYVRYTGLSVPGSEQQSRAFLSLPKRGVRAYMAGLPGADAIDTADRQAAYIVEF